MKEFNRLSILYAEDDKDARDMLSVLLGFSDIDVSFARSVKEAFQLAQNEPFDLYLLDNSFPEGNGLELCRQLREFNPQTPIIFYSGNAYETDKQKGLAAGANAYLVKPDSNTIAETIFRLVPQNRASIPC
ncbi:MAG TPA: response regulator [Pyrinomonadaceae bacterium]|nr:response regulator [Pyrinomonadaceae bacterium]